MSSLNRLAPSTTITPLSGQRSSAGTGMPPLPSPFSFPFSTLPLGLNLFDVASTSSAASSSSSQVIDPARILNLLHQQTLLAEELLKYHNMLFPGNNPGINPFMESLTSKPSIEFFKLPSTEQKDSNDKNDPSSSNSNKKTSTTVASSTSEIDLTINKDSLSEIRSETSTPIIKPRPESELLSDKPSTSISAAAVSAMLIDPDELKCHICMAQFPSLWLLEQHTALQHSQLSGNDKPFKCDQCGQNYRYNCCHYQSTLLRNQEINSNFNRSRIPADKLFTCDVCGMQFRYLKSFKKHRLNHALERLHGKKDKLATGENSGELMVSSTNDESGSKSQINLDDETMMSDEEQDETIDSISNINTVSNNSNSVDPNTSISSDNTGGDITDKNSAIIDCDIQITSGNTAQSESNQLTESKSQEPESTIPTASTSLAMHNVPSNFQMQHTSNSLKNLLSAETITNQQLMGLNSQEVSILNFLRVDAAEKQRDKRFACPFCGKCVRSKENLKLHVRKHTGERPFVCLFCGRAFGGKSDLTRHLRIHTGERPYHCESCGKCFARADYLSKHLTTHVHNTQQQQQR